LQTGNTYTSLRKNKPKKRDFQIIKLGLEIERNILNERINKRTDEMVKSGWLDEARTVYPYRQLNALNTVGFKELFAYFDGKMTFKDATEKIKTNTRRFAKRQMTWFKKDAGISWFNPKDKEKIISYLYDNL
jgi:tRNA dimethylallyltransferase